LAGSLPTVPCMDAHAHVFALQRLSLISSSPGHRNITGFYEMSISHIWTLEAPGEQYQAFLHCWDM